MRAPFPYFGGKSRIAAEVWRAFGDDIDNYVEPFFGSGAVLLGKPAHIDCVETVNDADCYIANFWRAVSYDPDLVAAYCDWPVNEADLESRHKWLVTHGRKRDLTRRCKDDPDFYDAQIAGWWCWGLCAWIGSGWCAGEWHGPDDEKNFGAEINTGAGKRPDLGSMGVRRQKPRLGDAGVGVHRGSALLADWFGRLAQRLRRVRVCCGDWSRVTSPAVTTIHGVTAVFLDPPYTAEAGRDNNIYSHDDLEVGHAVAAWAFERGDDPLMRIALCGYEGEYDAPGGWRKIEWKGSGGYGVQGNGRGRANAARERVWLSPHCPDASPYLWDAGMTWR